MEPRPQPPAYAAGQTVDVPADWYASAPYTLVLFARASCGACQQASPFLQQLVREMRGKGDVLFASPGLEPESDREYARTLGVPDDRTRQVPAGLRVRATPTLVLVDRSGRIHGAWEGVGPADQQARIQHEIQRTIHAVSSAD
jgi:thioredoxin-like negative regulator of GroEL